MKRPRSVKLQIVLAAAAAFASAVYAQQQKPTTGSNPSSNGSAGTSTPSPINGSAGTLSGTTGTRNSPLNNSSGLSDQSRPVFLMGNVMFDDGTAPNNDIRIERVCNGTGVHTETHTDSKGRFSFQVGGEQGNSISNADSSNSTFGGNGNGFGPTSSGLGSNSNTSLQGCELRAAYPGYVSESVDLSTHHSLDDPKIGTILLHRLSAVKGTTLSLTSAQAPKSAQKNYEKGMALAQKGKLEDAETRLANATEEYPKYAEAWFALGQVQQHLNNNVGATKSYMAAAAADVHYLSPLDSLARLSAFQQNWAEAASYSQQVIDMNPYEFPSSFWYNAIANYNLKKFAAAEKSARGLLKIDSRHQFPEAETMLAEITTSRGDLDEAAAHLKTYLALVPNAKNTDAVKRELAQIDAARTTRAKNTPTAAPPSNNF